MDEQKGPEFPDPAIMTLPFLSGDTTVTLDDAWKVPDAPNEVQIDAEHLLYITYTGKEENTLTGVTRNVGSFTGDVPAGTAVAAYLDMIDECRAIQYSDRPNEERLADLSHLLGWNADMAEWVDAEEQTPLQRAKLDRYYASYRNNLGVIWQW